MPNFEPIREFIVVLVTFKNEEDLITNKDDRVVVALFTEFSELTRKSVMDSNWSRHFPKYKYMGIVPDAQCQLTPGRI